MPKKPSNSYVNFLTKLKSGGYEAASTAKTAIRKIKGITPKEVQDGLVEITTYFTERNARLASPPAAAAEVVAEPNEEPGRRSWVALVNRLFKNLNTQTTDAVVNLRTLIKDEVHRDQPFSDEELKEVIGHILAFEDLTSFRELMYSYAERITSNILDLDALMRVRDVWNFINVILVQRPYNGELLSAVTGLMLDEAANGASDPEKVKGFESAIKILGGNIDLVKLGPVVVEFASPSFVVGWIKERNNMPVAVGKFMKRLMSLYLSGITDGLSLFSALEEFKPELPVWESVIRCVLVKRNLGDALAIAERAPTVYHPHLYRMLHPIVQQHADPTGLMLFAMAFPVLVDRVEIMELLKRHFEPDSQERVRRMSALMDRTEPLDYYNAIPTFTDQQGATQLREAIHMHMGHPWQSTIGNPLYFGPDDGRSFAQFLKDLSARARKSGPQ